MEEMSERLAAVIAAGEQAIAVTRDDPMNMDVAKRVEDFIGEMIATGAESRTIVTIITSAVGYGIGRGCSENGCEAMDAMDAVAEMQAVLVASCVGGFGSKETVQ